MKKVNTLLMGLAAATMTFTACSDAEDIMPNESNKGKGITIIAENPDVENNTRTELASENGKLVPYWSSKETLQLFFYSPSMRAIQPSNYISYADAPRKTAEFTYDSAPLDENTEWCMGTIHASNDVFKVDYRSDNSKILDYSFIVNRKAFRPGSGYMDNDVLVTELITKDMLNRDVMNVKMKRLSSVMRVNVIDNTSKKIITDDNITGIWLYCENAMLSGKMSYNFETEELTFNEPSDNPSVDAYCSLNIDFPYRVGDAPVYFSTKPADLKQGDVLNIKVQTLKGYVLSKDVTIGEKGVSLVPGMITTLNINVDDNMQILEEPMLIDDPTPDASIDPTVTPNCIVMKQKGRLTSAMVAEALNTGNALKISGDINAYDFYSLARVLSAKHDCNAELIDLDLSDANIIGGDGAEYINYFSKTKCFIERNNLMPNKLLYDCHKLRSIILPESLEELEKESVVSNGLSSITIGKNVKKMAKKCISSDLRSNIYVTVNAKPSDPDGIKTKFLEFSCSEKYLNLKLNQAWKTAENAPYEITWKRIDWLGGIEYIDDNGNVVERIEI